MQHWTQALAAGVIVSMLAGPVAGGEAAKADASSSDAGEVREWKLPALPRYAIELWDAKHYLRLAEHDPGRMLLVERPGGSVVYEGPLDTESDWSALSPAVRRKLERLLELPGVTIFIDNADSAAVEASFDQHWPEDGQGELAVSRHDRVFDEGLVAGPSGQPLRAMRRLVEHRLVHERPEVRRVEVTVPRQELVLVPAETF